MYLSTSYITLQDVPVKELEKLAEALMEGLVSAISTKAEPKPQPVVGHA